MTELGWRWEALGVVTAMEKTRAENNIQWMNLLRLAIAHAPPEELRKVLSSISTNDQSVSTLWLMLQSKIPD